MNGRRKGHGAEKEKYEGLGEGMEEKRGKEDTVTGVVGDGSLKGRREGREKGKGKHEGL